MPKLTAKKAERLLLDAGYDLLRVKGSHHIYGRKEDRMVLLFHAGKTLHPKIVKQVMNAIEKK